jgi:hypothetical protein
LRDLRERSGWTISGCARPSSAPRRDRSTPIDLGGHLIKQRVARPGGGRSGGYRTVIAYRAEQRGVFLYGFAKSGRDNIDDKELNDLRKLARHYLGFSEQQIAVAPRESELQELVCDDEGEAQG